jgi:NAD(P)H-nitrite reductase large subunit
VLNSFRSGPRRVFIDELEKKAKEQAIIDNFRPICLCNKIRKGVVVKAIQAGANTFEMVSKRTGIGTGPCGAKRCGAAVRGLLGEPVTTCHDCGWPILLGPAPLICPRCESVQKSD